MRVRRMVHRQASSSLPALLRQSKPVRPSSRALWSGSLGLQVATSGLTLTPSTTWTPSGEGRVAAAEPPAKRQKQQQQQHQPAAGSGSASSTRPRQAVRRRAEPAGAQCWRRVGRLPGRLVRAPAAGIHDRARSGADVRCGASLKEYMVIQSPACHHKGLSGRMPEAHAAQLLAGEALAQSSVPMGVGAAQLPCSL